MAKVRISSKILQQSDNLPPNSLDYLEFDFKGVTFRCFGILHGITGGLNRDYREFIKQSIKAIDGVKLAEKGMKQLYRNCGIEAELEDWAVLRPIDSFVMGFQLLADPRSLWMITIDALREKFRKHDAFITNKRTNISDLGESSYFHYLDEQERREIAGFLPSQQAISNDLKSMTHWYSAIIPKSRHKKIDHPQWRRLLLLERVMHIPCRSIHMLHYALSYAQTHSHQQINLLIGETHNTDMQFLAENINIFKSELDSKQLNVIQKIIVKATNMGKRRTISKNIIFGLKKINYLVFLLMGAASALSLYFVIYVILNN
ncbi:MAG: hypothetical protein KAT06_07190 [Gammaproteobacteria bacterium]|nr:hypothetical protein [Gammaproteobacteria bacterium]